MRLSKMATLTTASNKSLNTLLGVVMKRAEFNASKDAFNARHRVTFKKKALVDKFCKDYLFTDESGIVWEVNYSSPQNDQLPIYFYGKVVEPIQQVSEPVEVNKTQLKKELAQAKRDLKEVSKEYDRVASRSINPDVDMAVIRVLGQKYDLKAKVAALTEQLECLIAN